MSFLDPIQSLNASIMAQAVSQPVAVAAPALSTAAPTYSAATSFAGVLNAIAVAMPTPATPVAIQLPVAPTAPEAAVPSDPDQDVNASSVTIIDNSCDAQFTDDALSDDATSLTSATDNILTLVEKTLATGKPAIVTQATGLNVAVNFDQNGDLSSVMLVDHNGDDRYVTKTALLELFDADNNGIISKTEFENQKNNVSWFNIETIGISFLPDKPVLDDKGQPMDHQAAVNMALNYFYKANKYLSGLGIDISFPSSIVFGKNGAGDYADADYVWHLSDCTKEVMLSKIFQTTLVKSDPDLGYKAVETFSLYFMNDFLVKDGQQALLVPDNGKFIYNPDYEDLSAKDIYEAYQAYNRGEISSEQLESIKAKVGNNNIATYLGMKDIDAKTIKKAVDFLADKTDPTGPDMANAIVLADCFLNKGRNYSTIADAFKDRGITVDPLPQLFS